MRKLLVLCGTILCLSMTTAAQDAPAAFDAGSPAGEPAAPVSFHVSDRQPWQLGFGYQYQHFNILGQTFYDNGFNTDFTGYLNDWFGLEATAVVGFGSIDNPVAPGQNVTGPIHAKSTFIGGGPHLAVHREGRFEPWGHVLVGWDHFRFTQTNNVIGLGSNSTIGFMAGGGVDFKLFPRTYLRVQGDAIGSRFGATREFNYSIGTGIVFNF